MNQYSIVDGALCMDGGSISLEVVDGNGHVVQVNFDHSIAAVRSGTTSFQVDSRSIPPGSIEENRWIEILSAAAPRPSHSSSSFVAGAAQRVCFAADAKEFLDASAESTKSALEVLRRRLVVYLQNSAHKNQTPAPSPGVRSGPLPLP